MKTKLMPFDIEKAKAGAKIVTKNGLNVIIREYCDDELYNYPIEAIVKNPADDTGKDTLYYTKEGRFLSSSECDLDLLIEEEEETDKYDPYKATVESISDMVKRYTELQSLEELKDFYDNVNVKCREAVEYDKKWCKKQDEKPADNKPKFQKGDWVISKQGRVQKITNVIENVTNHTYGYDTVSCSFDILSYGYFNENVEGIRLWDINDAKDGDVLYSLDSKQPFIFKHRTPHQQADVYCGINVFGKFFVENTEDCIIVVDKYVPADKFQRERLFQKMKEAGYEWNSDKKKLHKIGEIKTRKMTHQELSWWLRDCPEEHRECKFLGGHTVYSSYGFNEKEANTPIENIFIRKNGGEWQEPLVEI